MTLALIDTHTSAHPHRAVSTQPRQVVESLEDPPRKITQISRFRHAISEGIWVLSGLCALFDPVIGIVTTTTLTVIALAVKLTHCGILDYCWMWFQLMLVRIRKRISILRGQPARIHVYWLVCWLIWSAGHIQPVTTIPTSCCRSEKSWHCRAAW